MFASALWPSVPYLVPENSVGIAYGVVTAVQNAGLAGIPLIVSAVYGVDDLYIPKVELVFIAFAVRIYTMHICIDIDIYKVSIRSCSIYTPSPPFFYIIFSF